MENSVSVGVGPREEEPEGFHGETPERGVVDGSRRATPMDHYRTIACLVELGGVLGSCRSRHFPLLIFMAGTAFKVLLRITTTVGCSFMCDTHFYGSAAAALLPISCIYCQKHKVGQVYLVSIILLTHLS